MELLLRLPGRVLLPVPHAAGRAVRDLPMAVDGTHRRAERRLPLDLGAIPAHSSALVGGLSAHFFGEKITQVGALHQLLYVWHVVPVSPFSTFSLRFSDRLSDFPLLSGSSAAIT